MKDPKKVQLFRFADPLMGPRRIPSIEKPLEGKIEILANEIFKINIDTKEVFLVNQSGKIPLGDSIIVRI